MAINVAINGLGRIGRMVLRLMIDHPEFNVVAVNDIVPPDNLAYLLKYDSTHGTFQGSISHKGDSIIVNGKEIHAYCVKDPSKLPWKELNVDCVIESTGLFTNAEDANKHLIAGCKRVIITAPSKGDIPTFVMGVNHKDYNPSKDQIVSNASCTTNCLAPITKILLDNFGIEEGLMTTVHAMTATQPTVDGPSKKDWRGGTRCCTEYYSSIDGCCKSCRTLYS